MFPFAPGVRSADKAVRLPVVDQLLDDLELGGRCLGRAQLPFLGDHRQLGKGPSSIPGWAVFIRLSELYEMAERPSHDIALA